jgi:hypothetical protein
MGEHSKLEKYPSDLLLEFTGLVHLLGDPATNLERSQLVIGKSDALSARATSFTYSSLG